MRFPAPVREMRYVTPFIPVIRDPSPAQLLPIIPTSLGLSSVSHTSYIPHSHVQYNNMGILGITRI